MKLIITSLTLLTVGAEAANLLTINIRNRFISASNPILEKEGPSSLSSTNLLQLGYFDTVSPTMIGSVAFDNFVPFEDPSGDLARDLGFDDSGTFSGEAKLNDEVNAPNASSTTLQIGLRFFNGATPEDSTSFNTVTNADWRFTFVDENTNPPPLPSTIDISGFNQSSRDAVDSAVWEGTPFRTVVDSVPEPSTSLSALLGLGLLLGSRRR